MGDSDHVLGPTLGRLHAWRDRGAVYVDGVRTSVQAGMLGAGVAKGAGFTGTEWALVLGVGVMVGLEGLKLLVGWADYHFKVINTHSRIASEAQPVTMRMVQAMEEIRDRLPRR